mmetsp:Transcript_7433/g.9009  ORF Transcript_7433/g.9009 Transcript_7433/m.9009 type:complete len:143 (-) Transcript_7433:29-457(-)
MRLARPVLDDGDECNVTITNVAGNSQAKDLVSRFCKNTHCILVCYSIISEGSFRDIDEWVDGIKELPGGSDIPIVLIGTKSDLAEDSRAVSDRKGNCAKRAIGKSCFQFTEITTFTDDMTHMKSLLEEVIVPAAKNFAKQGR